MIGAGRSACQLTTPALTTWCGQALKSGLPTGGLANVLVLDTDHLSEFDRGSAIGGSLRSRLSTASDEVVTTIVTVEEQLRGWLTQIKRAGEVTRQIAPYERLRARLEFFAGWRLLPWDSVAADLFDDLRRQGVRVGTMDLKIACIAITQDATRLSRNLKDFGKVPGLTVEDWL